MRFTQEQGDEEAARLTGLFAELTRETVLSGGGELIELRGDEALCVFGSQCPRPAWQRRLHRLRVATAGLPQHVAGP